MPRGSGSGFGRIESVLVNAEQARIASILAKAVAKYIRDDQRADYPLPAPVRVVIRSWRLSEFVKAPYTTKDGTLSVTPLGDHRLELIAHAFPRSGKWNGPDLLPNDNLRSMLASLFHDLIWEHAGELCDAWKCYQTDLLRWGNGCLYLIWVWASKDSWWGRREAWLAFQATEYAAPVYHKVKKLFSKTATAIVLAALCAGCAGGCFSVPDGEVESIDGVETVEQVMSDYGDGLGPGPDEKEAR